ncbi:serine/threonine-protein kinase [Umezawaea endophytica]|uniref:non-specific serine/threonine protein kinase n=1 Tax=Umezawaea endophytica TaxID=1654476 RepID=A0A9X3A0S3_9PSEU|nr:serine/threonine-protein kinase [Umezawaea endophytica]MCS7477253.1 serine/threonine protein kinase [Umezawaea endophytica]
MSEENRRVAGRYELTERVGGGAMGLVWLARDLRLDRVVAVKELLLPSHLDEKQSQQARRRAMREARIAARLQHPNAIAVYDVVEDDGQPWLIMEYLPSKSLAAVISASGPLPVDDVVRIGAQLATALAAAHKASVVHRDVKPGNVLLGDAGAVKITDFGISRAIDDATATATGRSVGTPAFFSPEVAKGEDGGYPSDVFSLGATLYNAVEGTPPFGISENSIAQLHRVAEGTIRPPENAGTLTPVLLRLLDPNPETRPTMAEAAEELAVLSEISEPTPTLVEEVPAPAAASASTPAESTDPVPPPVAPSTPPEPSEPPSPSTEDEEKRRKRAIFGLIGATVLLLAVVGAAFLYANRDKPDQNGQSGNPSGSTVLTTTSQAGEQPPAETTQSGATTTTASSSAAAPTTTTTTPPPAAPTAAQAIVDYYAVLQTDKAASYARLTEKFKQARAKSFDDYTFFWSQNSATVGNVVEQGPNTVTATVTYNGNESENHVYTLVQQNGQWMIDVQVTG